MCTLFHLGFQLLQRSKFNFAKFSHRFVCLKNLSIVMYSRWVEPCTVAGSGSDLACPADALVDAGRQERREPQHDLRPRPSDMPSSAVVQKQRSCQLEVCLRWSSYSKATETSSTTASGDGWRAFISCWNVVTSAQLSPQTLSQAAVHSALAERTF